MPNTMNRNPDKRVSLKDRQRVLDLTNQGLSVAQIAERMAMSAPTVKKIMVQGIQQCAGCNRLTDRGELCPVCSLPADAPPNERLKAFRTVADVSQMALALQIGVHVSRVRNWEKGRTQPNETEMAMLAEGLGLDVQDLTGNAQAPKDG
jgi:transcriptional regulator with XRE-family HTH domain